MLRPVGMGRTVGAAADGRTGFLMCAIAVGCSVRLIGVEPFSPTGSGMEGNGICQV